MGMNKQEFESRYGRLPANAIYLDLDETKTIERKTKGWTDEQIKNKTLAQFDEMLRTADLAIKNLEDAAEGERQRRQDLLAIRNRRTELGE
jgi:hypothetical protein